MKLNTKKIILTIITAVVVNMLTTFIMDLVKYPEHKIETAISRGYKTFLWDFSDKDCDDSLYIKKPLN